MTIELPGFALQSGMILNQCFHQRCRFITLHARKSAMYRFFGRILSRNVPSVLLSGRRLHLAREISCLASHREARLLGSNNDLAEGIVPHRIRRIVGQFVGMP